MASFGRRGRWLCAPRGTSLPFLRLPKGGSPTHTPPYFPPLWCCYGACGQLLASLGPTVGPPSPGPHAPPATQ